MAYRIADFPFWLRFVVVITLGLLAINIFFFFGPFVALVTWANSINAGLATLIGSLIGLSILAIQTRIGFRNLIASQEHRAEKERDARADQARIERETRAEETDRDKKALASALAGELLSVWYQLRNAGIWYKAQELMLEGLKAAGEKNYSGSLTLTTCPTPVYDANVSKLGLLGSSVAGDVARVFSRVATRSPKPESHSMMIDAWIKIFKAMADNQDEWLEDVSHVVSRLYALEHGTPLPRPLSELERERQAKKQAAEKK
jgi:hypothetical protein